MIADDAETGSPALLGRDYWLVRSWPHETTTTEDIERVAGEHVAWLLKLEAEGRVFLSGPLTSGPGVVARGRDHRAAGGQRGAGRRDRGR